MKRRRLIVIVGAIGLVVVCAFPKYEFTFEFDSVNLRLRDCARYRSWLLGFTLWQSCSPPDSHPTATRLRELGVLPEIDEQDSQWVLIKGFKSGVRGWKGRGSYILQALGATTFGTPVTLPAKEDVTQNVWVKWTVKDPEASAHFWKEVRALAFQDKIGWRAEQYLLAAREYLEKHKENVVGAEVEEYARRASDK
jgi:hypothetical protein